MGGITQPELAAGFGQTMQNVSGSRSSGVTYYNTTPRPIMVYVTGQVAGVNGDMVGYVDSLLSGRVYSTSSVGLRGTVHLLVPPNSSYQITTSIFTVEQWVELR